MTTNIKLIIFDLDGVLVDARDMHYKALNKALAHFDKKYIINPEEHLACYDGLPTKRKLQLLTQQKGLPTNLYNEIWTLKQDRTVDEIEKMSYNYTLCNVLRQLKELNYKVCVASNSIRTTTNLMLFYTGLIQFVDKVYSNEDVTNPKPSAEIFMKCMLDMCVNPDETLIIEDSHIGRKAAQRSGAHVLGVMSSQEVAAEHILNCIHHLSNKTPHPKWQDHKMNIVIPMAGEGSRFAAAGYTFPKPLIEIHGKPMIQLIVENLNIDGHYIFITRKEHHDKYNLKQMLKLITNNKCTVLTVDHLTEGAACTVLLAKDLINNDNPLLLANSDQYVDWNSNEFLYAMQASQIDGGILTFPNTHPKWSYAKLGPNGFVCEVAEKKPISNHATVGIYYYKRGSDFVKYAEQMIEKNVRVNNEFYVCPVYNEMIADNKKVKVYPLEEGQMWGLGTPEDLSYFLQHHK